MGSILNASIAKYMKFFKHNPELSTPDKHPRSVERKHTPKRPSRIGRLAVLAGMLPSLSFAPSHVDANNQHLGASYQELSLIKAKYPDDLIEKMSFNIAGSRYGIEKVVDTIEREDPDIVALQEISPASLQYIKANSSLKTSAQSAGSRNAILTNLEVVDSEVIKLHNSGGHEQRTLELATVKFNDSLVLVGSFHQIHDGSAIFGDAHSAERLQQSIDIATATSDPKYDGLTQIISGDANTGPSSQHYEVLTRNLTDATLALGGIMQTFRGFLYDSQKDYTLISEDARAVEQHTINMNASDHYALVTSVLIDN